MKKVVSALVLGWMLALGCAQKAATASESVWLTDLPAAQAKALAEHKMVFMNFTGSDWCAPCKEFEKKVLSTPEFAAYAKDNLVLVEVDFPETKEQSEELKKANHALSEQFKVEGFPTIIILDAEGKELRRDPGFKGGTAKEFVEELKKLKA